MTFIIHLFYAIVDTKLKFKISIDLNEGHSDTDFLYNVMNYTHKSLNKRYQVSSSKSQSKSSHCNILNERQNM